MLPHPRVDRQGYVTMVAREDKLGSRVMGTRELLEYLWPKRGAYRSKASIILALILLLVAKLYIVRVPFIFKAAVDSLSSSTVTSFGAARYFLLYGLSRGVYTLLQEARYLIFTPVGQSGALCGTKGARSSTTSSKILTSTRICWKERCQRKNRRSLSS